MSSSPYIPGRASPPLGAMPYSNPAMALAVAAVALLTCLTATSCREATDPALGQDSESEVVLLISEAFAAGDCATVENLAEGFVTSTVLRYRTLSTMLGSCRYEAGDYEGAAELLEEFAYDYTSNDAYAREASYRYGRALYRLGRYVEAAEVLGSFADRYSTDTRVDDARYYQGKSFEAMGAWDEALAAYSSVLTHPQASALRKAGAHFHTGEVWRALAANSPPTEAAVLADRARMSYQAVLASYKDSIYADDSGCGLGMLSYDLGDFEGAALLFQEFEASFPSSILLGQARYYRARCLEMAGDLLGALALLEGIEQLYPDSTYADNAACRVGRILVEMAGSATAKAEADRLYGEAKVALLAFLEKYGDSSLRPEGLFHLGTAHYGLAEYSPALTALDAVAGFSESVWYDNALYYAGMAQYHLGSVEGELALRGAIERFDRLLKDCPDSIYRDNAAYFRARSMVAIPSWQEARVALEGFLAQYDASPYRDNAWYQLVVVQLALGNCVGAADALDSLSKESPSSSYAIKANNLYGNQCEGV